METGPTLIGNDVNLLAYARIADKYHKLTKGLDMKWQVRMFSEMVPTPASLLDLCCGTGRDANLFSGLGYSVLGVDAVPEMVDIAREAAPNAEFTVADARTFDLGRTFDGVWCNTGIFMFPKAETATVLDRIAAHLEVGGPLYINFKMGEGEGSNFDKRYGVERYESYFQPEEFLMRLEEGGFDVVRQMVAYGQNRHYQPKQIMDVWARKK